MKKILALTLSLLMVFTVIPMAIISASADSTETKFLFNKDYFTLSDNTANMYFSSSDGYDFICGTIADGTGVTMTSVAKLDPGVYDTTLYARARAVRPPFDIEVNGTVIGEAIDTSNTVLGLNNDAPVTLKSITIPSTTYVTIRITGSAGITSRMLYLNSIKFTKTADYVPPIVTMKKGAAIRLNEQNGIRFYTTVDTAKLEELKAVEGNVVELGTLIAPADLVTGELTHEIGEANYVDVSYKADTFFEDNTFVGSIVNIKSANYGRAFIGRGYIKVTNGSDVTYYYAKQDDNARSVKAIAQAYIDDANSGYSELDTKTKELVDNWAAAADWSAQ